MKKWNYQCTECDKIHESIDSDDAKNCREKNHELMKVPTEKYKRQSIHEIGSKINHSFVKHEKDKIITSTINE